VESVAPGDDVALDGHARAVEEKAQRRAFGLEVVQPHIAHLEEDRMTGRETDRNQVLDDLLLSVHGDAATAGERAEVDAVVATPETQPDTVVHEALATHPRTDPGGIEQVRASLLEHAGAHAVLDVRAGARLDHDRLDPLEAQ
jgi:hypothetical protein